MGLGADQKFKQTGIILSLKTDLPGQVENKHGISLVQTWYKHGTPNITMYMVHGTSQIISVTSSALLHLKGAHILSVKTRSYTQTRQDGHLQKNS